MNKEEIERRVRSAFAKTIQDNGTTTIDELSEETILLETSLDSLGFAILVARLEEDLGWDPSRSLTGHSIPRRSDNLLRSMPITSLKQTVLDRQVKQAVLISEHGSWGLTDLNVLVNADILTRARSYRSVALRVADPAKLALALLALDGFVGRMLLLSADLADDLASSLSAKFGADVILTDLDGNQTPRVADHLVWTGPIGAGPDQSLSPSVATEWTLTTSGTTGVPKLVTHTLESLSRTTKGTAIARYRWGQLYSMERFAGLQVFLQALLGGVLVLPRPEWPLSERLSYLSRHGCTALSATPTLWRKILMTPVSASLSPMQIT